MDVNKILGADLLDIVFEGRNKEYGAYELRSQYKKRLTTAMLITASLMLLLVLGSFILKTVSSQKGKVEVKEVQLEEIKQEEKNEPPPPPPPPKPPDPPKVEMAKFTPPKVVPDEEVKEDEKPPEIEKLEETKIGTVNQEGAKDEGEFPGGTAGWTRYVTREIERNIDELQDEGKSGTVVVLFIVDKEGGVSEVRALSCSEAGVANCLGANTKLAEIAVNAIRRGPKWKPAAQNGRNVKAYRRQPVTFQLAEE